MASFTKSEMKKLCDHLGCDSNGKADEMKFNVLLKIYAEAQKDDDSGEEKAEQDEEFKFFVEVKFDGEAEWYGLVQDATVLDLKKEISEKMFTKWGELLPVDQQRLLSKKGKLLNTDVTISSIVADSDEQETSRLHMILELEGGGKIMISAWKSFM